MRVQYTRTQHNKFQRKSFEDQYNSGQFRCFCLDIGASRRVIWTSKLQAFGKFYRTSIYTRPMQARFNCSVASYASELQFTFRLPAPDDSSLFLDVTITHAKIILLVVLDAMIHHNLDLMYSSNTLTCAHLDCNNGVFRYTSHAVTHFISRFLASTTSTSLDQSWRISTYFSIIPFLPSSSIF